MNQRVAHINIDTANTLVIPTPKRICLRIPLPDARFAGCEYELTMGGDSYNGSLNESGEIDILLENSQGQGLFKLWFFGKDSQPIEWPLDLGMLQAIETLEGVQARLNNLGYEAGPVDGIMGRQTRRAVKRFQQAENLKMDGEPGNTTQQALLDAHGC